MRILLGCALALGFSTAALAADLDIDIDTDEICCEDTAPWDGVYAGLGLAGAYNVNFAETFGFVDGILGVNVQAENWVVGGEVAISGWRSNLAGPGLSTHGQLRTGYLVTPEVLLYGSLGALYFISGGAAYGQLGVGTEFMLAQDLSLDLEYKYWREFTTGWQTHSISTSLLWHF
jgi:opacity protein-like surface antigen